MTVTTREYLPRAECKDILSRRLENLKKLNARRDQLESVVRELKQVMEERDDR